MDANVQRLVTMDLVESLSLLAEQNVFGLAFLSAYGLTWLICGFVWWRATERVAAFATLFQGMVAFPVALGVSALIGAIGQQRPVPEEITQLSVLIGTSQLLGLPLLIYLIVRHHYTLVPFVFATITAIHFVLYAWLYQTLIYIVMAALISLGTATVMFLTPDANPRTGAIRVCLLTGSLLVATATVFLGIHLFAR